MNLCSMMMVDSFSEGVGRVPAFLSCVINVFYITRTRGICRSLMMFRNSSCRFSWLVVQEHRDSLMIYARAISVHV